MNNPTIQQRCCTCKQYKPLDSFYNSKNKAFGKHPSCRLCCSISRKRLRTNGKASINERSYVKKYKQWFKSIKENQSCAICGENKYWRLAFHHKDPNKKDLEIATMIGRRKPMALVLEEIAKCIIVCHNCHSDIHHQLRQDGSEF